MRFIQDELRYSASDLSNFLACRHLTRLEVAALHGLVEKPHVKDLGFEALAKRGEEHEQQVLEGYRSREWSIVEIAGPFSRLEAAAEETREALDRGVDVVNQAALNSGDRVGYPDFLVRAELLGGEGPGYEVVDAKLARTAKAGAVLQATFYSRLLAETVGHGLQRLHLALGGVQRPSFPVADFAAYERQIDRLLHEVADEAPSFPILDPYPAPVEHCVICRWRLVCKDRRRADDDLSLIAGITAQQTKGLKEEVDVATRREFAKLQEPPSLQRVGEESLKKIHLQARIQVRGEDQGEMLWEFVDPERDEEGGLVPNRGLLALPEPAKGDLFFDIEGSRFYSEDAKEFGLQYLFGVVNTAEVGANGRPTYRAFWAFDRAGERAAFGELMDFLIDHLERYPGAHIYHYNHYEPTTVEHLADLHLTREEILGRLMGRFATREDDLDRFFKLRLFVDLYRVVRQGIRASVESYSIKSLEGLIGYQRSIPLAEVNEQMVTFEADLDGGKAEGNTAIRATIQGYNEDDCRSTQALRDWLEARRVDLGREIDQEVPRPQVEELEERPQDPEVAELREALLRDLPEDPTAWSDEQRARALMADLLEYHRRDDKPGWWRYFHIKRDLSHLELRKEPDAISGLEFLKEVGSIKKSTLFQYRFPPQEHGFRGGKRAEDPDTNTAWTLYDLDDGAGTLTIKATRMAVHPQALIETGPVLKKAQELSLKEIARRVIQAGQSEWPHDPAIDLLLRRCPNVASSTGALVRDRRTTTKDAERLALQLHGSHLAIQGPPGTGKTYTGACQIIELVRKGRKIGVTATSHAVICHMLDEVAERAAERGVSVRIGQRIGNDEQHVHRLAKEAGRVYSANPRALQALEDDEVDVVGGTTWLWAREEFRDSVDVLVVDEAGQMCLADALAASAAASNLILLGDPMQLAQPSQGSHPPGSGVSALEHILGDAATMPEELGLFIEETRRMHPNIMEFTSETFYEGRLTGMEGLEHQEVLGEGALSGSGLRMVEVTHTGNANRAPEEAREIARIVGDLQSREWRDRKGKVHEFTQRDVLVVTPFNAQVREIQGALADAGFGEVRVGTVDKFQGQEAPVAIYSMASSSAEEAPRGLNFLYDLHRLNVATSRAQTMAIVVASPDLVRVFCRTPDQMRLVNALCSLGEHAARADAGRAGAR